MENTHGWGAVFTCGLDFIFFHMLKNVETLESNNPDPLKEKLNATTTTGRGRSAPGWLERRTSTPSRPSCWRGMKLTPSVTLELQQQQVSFTMHSLCVHFMSFYLKLASEPPYGECLTSHNRGGQAIWPAFQLYLYFISQSKLCLCCVTVSRCELDIHIMNMNLTCSRTGRIRTRALHAQNACSAPHPTTLRRICEIWSEKFCSMH